MSILCDCSNYSHDGPDVCTTVIRTARKEHICCECEQMIEPGQQYEHVKGCWDGSWGTYKTCTSCVAIRSEYCSGGYIYGELAETVSECLGVELI